MTGIETIVDHLVTQGGEQCVVSRMLHVSICALSANQSPQKSAPQHLGRNELLAEPQRTAFEDADASFGMSFVAATGLSSAEHHS
jgi:hypothetical protein